MTSPTASWTRFCQQVLVLWVFVAALFASGCAAIKGQTASNPLHQRVCPTCSARTIAECHCFRPAESAGYCETNWYSLEPTFEHNIFEHNIEVNSYPAIHTSISDFLPDDSHALAQPTTGVGPQVVPGSTVSADQPLTVPVGWTRQRASEDYFDEGETPQHVTSLATTRPPVQTAAHQGATESVAPSTAHISDQQSARKRKDARDPAASEQTLGDHSAYFRR